jgi:hypothetical protein
MTLGHLVGVLALLGGSVLAASIVECRCHRDHMTPERLS